MTKRERENIDYIIEGLDTQRLEMFNRDVSRLAWAYKKSNNLSKEQADTFETVCKQVEEDIAGINKFIDYLESYGTREKDL